MVLGAGTEVFLGGCIPWEGWEMLSIIPWDWGYEAAPGVGTAQGGTRQEQGLFISSEINY